MKKVALLVALLVLTLTVIDFARNTLPGFRAVKELRQGILARQQDASDRITRRGIPPEAATLQHLQASLERMRTLQRLEADRVFAGAVTLGDYLVDRDERPADLSVAAAHRLLLEAKDRYEQEARDWPLLLSPALQLTDGIEPDQDPDERLERFVVAAHLLGCLRVVSSIELRRFKLLRTPEGPLEVEFTVAAGINEALQFWELWLGEANDAPPCWPIEQRLRRLEAHEWGLRVNRFTTAPVELNARARVASLAERKL